MYLFIIMPLRKYDVAGLGHVPVHRTKGRKTDWMDQGSSIFHKSSSRVNILAGTDFTPIEEKLEVHPVQLDKSQVVRVPMFGLVRPVVGVDDDFGNLDSLKNARFQNNRNTSCRQRKYKLHTNEKKDIQIANKRRTI